MNELKPLNKNQEAMVQKIINENDLNYQLKKIPLIRKGLKTKTPTGYFGIFNGDICINTVKEGFKFPQNQEIVEMVVRGIANHTDQLKVTKASSLDNGGKLLFQMEVLGTPKIGGFDEITQYVTVIESRDGTSGFSVGIGDKVAHCQNQFFKFYKAGQYKWRHTSSLDEKIIKVPELIRLALDESMKQLEVYNKFVSTKLSVELANKAIESVMDSILGYNYNTISKDSDGKPNTRAMQNIALLDAAIKTEFSACGKNLWGLFNGVTRYTTHEMSVNASDKLKNLVIGREYNKAMAAYNTILELA